MNSLSVRDDICVWGQYAASYYVLYDTFLRLGLLGVTPMLGHSWVAMSAGWWKPGKNVCVVSERPTLYEPGPLNAVFGGRLVYADGFEVSIGPIS